MPSPVTDTEFSALLTPLAPFERRPTLAIAVSGGADSMALLLLAHAWTQSQNGHLIALTVDHHLRPESTAEAAQVAAWCAARHIEHHILDWQPPALPSAIPMQARTARYRLLTDWCKAHHILHLLTAHHRDDQTETLFFRLARHSHLDGLACMSPLTTLHGIRLLRPLLSLPKSRLQTTLTHAHQPWIEDPTNRNQDYTRNRIRHALQASPDTLSARAQAVTTSFAKIRNHLEYKLASRMTNNFSLFPEGYATLNLTPFLNLPADQALHALTALTLTLTGDIYPPRSEKLERLYTDLPTLTRRSFAGLLWIRKKNHLLIHREPKAISPPQPLHADTDMLWDNRFLARWSGPLAYPLTLRPLGTDGVRRLKARQNKSLLATLPSFWHLEQLISVPHIHYTHEQYSHISCRIHFRPAKPLAAPAFFSMNTA